MLTLPALDMAGFLDDPMSEAGGRFVDELLEAAHGPGFVYLTGHGVDPALGYGAIGLALCLLAWPRGETRGELDRELGRLLDEPESSSDPASPGAV